MRRGSVLGSPWRHRIGQPPGIAQVSVQDHLVGLIVPGSSTPSVRIGTHLSFDDFNDAVDGQIGQGDRSIFLTPQAEMGTAQTACVMHRKLPSFPFASRQSTSISRYMIVLKSVFLPSKWRSYAGV
jgi:hypothetical protein